MIEGTLTPAKVSAASPQNLLEPGERLIWWGQPRAWPYAILKTAFYPAFVAAMFVFGDDATNFFKKPELAYYRTYIILAVLLLVPFHAFFIGPTVFYAITDRRAVVIHGDVRKDMDLKKIQFILCKSYVVGINSLTFIEEKMPDGDFKGGYRSQRDGFFCIASLADVEAKLRQAATPAEGQ
jgi:hypothetical protein